MYPSGRCVALRAFGSLPRSQQRALLAGQVLRCADISPATLRWQIQLLVGGLKITEKTRAHAEEMIRAARRGKGNGGPRAAVSDEGRG